MGLQSANLPCRHPCLPHSPVSGTGFPARRGKEHACLIIMEVNYATIADEKTTKETNMINKEDIAAVLELIRPSLQADGGDVRLVDVNDDGIVSVELQGACQGCPLSSMTLANGIERILKERVPGVTRVVPAIPEF